MTKQQLEQFIASVINNNGTGEITAKDVRDALIAVYQTAIDNAQGGGGVAVPIGFTDVENVNGVDLQTAFTEVLALIGPINDVTQHMSVQNNVLMIDTETAVEDLFVGTLKLAKDGFVQTDNGMFTFTMLDLNDVALNSFTMLPNGNLSLPFAPTIAKDDRDVLTYGQYKNEIGREIIGIIDNPSGMPTKR